MVGSSSTITAVTVAEFRLGLSAAMKASGTIAKTSSASRLPSPECGIRTAIAPP